METYLVPVDFSKASNIALNHAVAMVRNRKGKVILLHVIADSAVMVPSYGAESATMLLEYERMLKANAQRELEKLVRRNRLKTNEHRVLLIRGGDPAQAIAKQAKKSRASMIIMGSHGRTGFQRFILGSVAERTLRYAQCPVLIVKK